MRHLISARDLNDTIAGAPAAVVFDCRFSLVDSSAGRRQYEEAHIPGARYADLERDLSGIRGAAGRHPLPDRDDLVERLRRWGVNNDSHVVCYDQNNGATACRLWWLVRWLGHSGVQVLDGGLDAWIAAGLPTDAAAVVPDEGAFEAGTPLTRVSSADDLSLGGLEILDARDAARFRGENEPFDPVAGHIPGAKCAFFGENIGGGRFRSQDELAARFRSLGVAKSSDIACYCGSGVTATHNILALLEAGYPEPALYPGSWSEWVSDPARPVATGS